MLNGNIGIIFLCLISNRDSFHIMTHAHKMFYNNVSSYFLTIQNHKKKTQNESHILRTATQNYFYVPITETVNI